MNACLTHAQPVDGSDIPDRPLVDFECAGNRMELNEWLMVSAYAEDIIRDALRDAALPTSYQKAFADMAKELDAWNGRSQQFNNLAGAFMEEVINTIREYRE